MQEKDLRIFDKYSFASRWGVQSNENYYDWIFSEALIFFNVKIISLFLFTCTKQLHVLIKDVHTKILKWYFPNTSQLSTFVLNFSIDKGKISFQK